MYEGDNLANGWMSLLKTFVTAFKTLVDWWCEKKGYKPQYLYFQQASCPLHVTELLLYN